MKSKALQSRSRLAILFASMMVAQTTLGFEEVNIAGSPVGERGSYVVRDGVPFSLPWDLSEGHAGLLTGVSSDEKGTLVYEIRGPGDYVQLSKFYKGDTWVHETPPEGTSSSDSFLGDSGFRGCGHPSYCDGLTPSQNKAYREHVDAQAWRAIGKPYINPLLETTTIWAYGLEIFSAGETRLTDGVPEIPDRFRCDGLVEWCYEAAQAVFTGMTGTQSVDVSFGIYEQNLGAWDTPKDLYAPPSSDPLVHTSPSNATLPNIKPLVSTPVINGKTYSASWTEPYDESGIFGYAYNWLPVGVSLDVVDPNTLKKTTNISVSGEAMPQGINAAGRYRFVVMAMDKMGHWSDSSRTYESPEIDWNPTSAPPTILTPPASQTVYLGQKATFSVSASGVAPLSYQWIEGGVDIPSATGTTFSIPSVTLADSGRSFSVRLTNPQGSVTSSAAVLTVSTSLDTGEPNDSSLTGTPLPMGASRSGYISAPTDVDWFKVVVDKTGLLNLALTVPSGMDYDLEIYGPDFLWKSGSYGLAGQNENVALSLLQTGTYHVRVYGYPVGAGAYDANRPYQISANLEVAASGVIDTAVTWSETVELTGDVVIAPGGSLTILPGTQIRIPKSDDQAGGNNVNITEIIVNGGTLTAVGTAVSPIVFTSSRSPKTAGDWYGIRVKGGNISLQHCVVEYAAEGIRFEDTDTRFETYALSDVTVRFCTGNGLWTASGQYAQPVALNNFKVIGCSTGLRADGPVTVAGGEIKNNTSDGVYSNTALVMNGVTVMANTGRGVYSAGGSTMLTDCSITHNGNHGVELNWNSMMRIGSCTVANNGGWGIYVYSNTSAPPSVELLNNTVQDNGSGGIALDRTLYVGLVGNIISSNNGVGLHLSLSDYAGLTTLGITDNSIFDNGGTGIRVLGNRPQVLNLSGNDIYDNTGFELRNESGISINMENAYLGKVTATEFGKQDNLSRIYDQHDHPSYGQVVVQSLNTGTMLLPPEITTHPQTAAVNLGASVTLSVAASGTGPISFQWYRNGSLISGATSSSLTLSGFDLGKTGSYHVVARNVAGQETSDAAQVTAIIPGGGTPNLQPKLELGRLSGYSTVSISGEIGRSYTIQTSDDLKLWKTLQVLTLTENSQMYVDWQSLGKTQRFYRVFWSE